MPYCHPEDHMYTCQSPSLHAWRHECCGRLGDSGERKKPPNMCTGCRCRVASISAIQAGCGLDEQKICIAHP